MEAASTVVNQLIFELKNNINDQSDHRLVLQYLRSYADHFQVSPNIRLNTKVERIEALSSQNGKAGDSGWKIKFADGSTWLIADVSVGCGTPAHQHVKNVAWGAVIAC